jgi:type IV pilus assembly protein PilM
MFDSITKNLFGPKSFLGCDIGTTSIKMVELARGNGAAVLKNYGMLETLGHFERSNNVIQANSLKISEKETSSLLAALVKRNKFFSQHVIASIPSFASFTTMLELPEMSDKETAETMSYQIKQNIPLPLSDITVDWIRVGAHEDENGFSKQQIVLVAIPNETIERYKRIFKGAGLTLHALEVEMLAYSRSLVGSDQTPTLIIDIGARSTNISVVDQGFMKGNTQIDYAGDSLTWAIAKGLGIGAQRAEELKKQKGLLGGRGEYELSTLEIPFVDVILHEASKVRANFENASHTPIQRVLLIGGGANLLGLEKYVESRMALPSAPGNGLLYVQAPAELAAVQKELETRFALATGLAIKGFV